MKISLRPFLALVALGLVAAAQTLPTVTPYQPTSFRDVEKYLNPDGSFHVYLSTEQWGAKLDGFVGQLRQGVLGAVPEGEEKQIANVVFHFIISFINESGLRSMRGVGLSSVAESETYYYNRLAVVHSMPGPPQGFYWDTIAGDNGPLKLLDCVPQDAVLATWSPFHPKPGWDWIKKTIARAEFEPMSAGFNQWIMGLRGMGVDLDQWVDSIGPGAGIVGTVSRDQTWPLPLPDGGKLEVPQMALALIFEVKDDTIFQFVDAMLQPMPTVVRVDDQDLRLRSVPVPMPIALNVKPTIARMGSYLILASNDDIVKAMDSCRHGETPSIRTTEEFKVLAKGLPTEGMGCSFLSRRFGGTVAAITQGSMAANPEAEPMAALMSALQREQSSYGVSLRMPDGIVGISRTDFELGETLIVQAAFMPVALMAGMTLPALAQARGKARTISDASNMKQIGVGMIMYVEDHQDKFPNDLGDLWDYVGDGRIFVCPAGQTVPPQNADQVRAGQCDYLYFMAGKMMPDIQNPSTTPAVCTKPGLLKQGVNVLYCDGHVESKPFVDAALQALIDQVR